MKKIDQLILINQVCDVFEADLKAGSEPDIERVLTSSQVHHRSVEFIDVLLTELIALQIAYSFDRYTTAGLLKLKYPDHVDEIESAIHQPSLFGNAEDANADEPPSPT